MPKEEICVCAAVSARLFGAPGELRHHDGRQDAEDDQHQQQFDEGEAAHGGRGLRNSDCEVDLIFIVRWVGLVI